jgi:hypothetical protein
MGYGTSIYELNERIDELEKRIAKMESVLCPKQFRSDGERRRFERKAEMEAIDKNG